MLVRTKLGWAAFERGDYATAVSLYRLAAAQGYAKAQYNLGHMYESGEGVVQDHKEAVRLYRLAAAQGNADAHYFLGEMYANGQGVPQDNVRAYMWYSFTNWEKDMNKIAAEMTRAQITQAQEMARKCKASNFKNCD